MRKAGTPPEGYVTTRDAAKMWGCHPNSLSLWMQEAGIAPVKASHPDHPQIVTYWWDPREVLGDDVGRVRIGGVEAVGVLR